MITKEEALGSLKSIGNIKIGEQYGVSSIRMSLHSPDYETVLDYINQSPQLDSNIEEALDNVFGQIDLCDRDLHQGQKLVQDMNTIKQAFIDKDNEMKAYKLKRVKMYGHLNNTNNANYTKMKQLQSQLDEAINYLETMKCGIPLTGEGVIVTNTLSILRSGEDGI